MTQLSRSRDGAFDRILTETLETSLEAGPAGPCLDAETVAAWADARLPARARAAAEAHAAQCGSCQELLAAMAATVPPTEARKRWWERSSSRVLAPLAVAAAAFVLWLPIATREHATYTPLSGRTTEVTELAASRSSDPQYASPEHSSDQASQAVADVRVFSLPKRSSDESLGRERLSAPPAGTDASRAASSTESAGTGHAAEQGAAADPQNWAMAGGDAKVASPVAPSPLADGVPPTSTVPHASLEARLRSSASRLKSSSSADPSLARLSEQATAMGREGIVWTDPASRWRIAASGAVEHSADGGATWETQETGVPSGLSAGSSPSPTVCWLVGAAGVVVRTTDGRTWRRLRFPESIALVSVRAASDQIASLTASDGRVFDTADGGATWREGAAR